MPDHLKVGDWFQYILPKRRWIFGDYAGKEVVGEIRKVNKATYTVTLYLGNKKIVRYIKKEYLDANTR